uniref:Uncharacterized protein n=1 Tax=Meloidogyne enterolobii TaxID=390850 RepID=A0A6V7WYT8_MELEN|nr:unnamed protein product [Meloidogyne enterolobii]
MDVDMKEVEIEFAQRLASGEPTVRKRALKLLREHVMEESKNGFTTDSLDRLCKGLHYALWMQDKMLLQEELADNILQLLGLLKDQNQIFEFVKALLFTLSKEWPKIDRWRMDKFLMFLRKIIRVLFFQLKEQKFNSQAIQNYLTFFSQTLISEKSKIFESLKYHCVSVWLDELDNAFGEGLDSLEFIKPFTLLMKENISDVFFESICTDIFDTILHDFSESLAQKKAENANSDQNMEEKESTPCLTFDYEKIAQLLFDSGKNPKIKSKRRKRIYSLCKQFDDAKNGIDPFPDLFDEEISKNEIKRRKKLLKEI